MSLCVLNGDLMPIEEATISPMDRGFLFGDGIYEVMAVVEGRIRALSLHHQRLKNSLEGIQLSVNTDQVMEQARIVLESSRLLDAKIYIQVTRGAVMTREHRFPEVATPTVFVAISPFTARQLSPCKALLRPDIRWSLNSIKSVSLLGNVLLQEEAHKLGALETILYRDGKVTEASTSNVFGLRNQVLMTPPLSDFILPGITRHLVIEEAKDLGLNVVETELPIQQLTELDTLFVTSSTRGLLPVVDLMPGGQIGLGKLSPIFHQLAAAYERVLHCHD